MSAITQDELNRLRDLFICPISYELFEDPVIENNSCAHTFERMFIQQWLLDHNTCPPFSWSFTDGAISFTYHFKRCMCSFKP